MSFTGAPSLLALASLGIAVAGCQSDSRDTLPIIDVHLHAYPALPPPDNPVWQAVPEPHRTDPPSNADQHRARTLAAMRQHNVVLGVLSGPFPALEAWREEASSSFLFGAWLLGGAEVRPSPATLRPLFQGGVYDVLGELNLQYEGLSFDDPRLEPYYAMAEELGVPVGLHSSGGPPGTPYHHAPRFRVSLGDPVALEPVLLRHPDLKVYLQHAGHPFLEGTKAMLGIYPQLYLDTGVLAWALPRAEFYAYLGGLVDAGFADRVMFGSDQVFWPSAIGHAIDAVREAPFLSDSQERDILYNNAARFLELPDSTIARHHDLSPPG